MGKIEIILEKAYRGLSKFNDKLQENTIDLVYGTDNQQVEMLNADFFSRENRGQVLEAVKNIKANPSLENINNTLSVINTYDLCNPLNFAVSQLFPPGSPVANSLGKAQGKIDEVVNKFRSFSLIEGIKEVNGEAVPDILTDEEIGAIPFKVGKIVLAVPFSDPLEPQKDSISVGSYVTITQTEDPKITSVMRGTVEISENVDYPFLGKEYVINVESISPSLPPYQKSRDGKVLTDPSGEELLKQFSSFKIEYESKLSGDVQELSKDLFSLTKELRELGINDISQQIGSLPNTIPGAAKLKAAFKEVEEVIEDIGDVAAPVANTTATAAGALSGGLDAQDVIERVRVLRDFYNKILPFTNITFAIQEIFKKEIESVNRFLRDAIPYDQIAKIVRVMVLFGNMILGIINAIVVALNFINTIIKTITVVLKVIRIILKVVRAVIKILPALFVPVGAIETVTNFLKGVEEGIERGIELLEKISKEIEQLINMLVFVKEYLKLIIDNGVKLAAKLESCEGFNKSGLQEAALEASRKNFLALKNLLTALPQLDKFNAGNDGSTLINSTGVSTFVVIDGEGTIMPLADTVFGFDENGEIIFYGDLVSLSTGVNFEDTLGQEFRSKLKYYTFNKFNPDKHETLLKAAENVYNQKQVIEADPNDRFGNFQEIYLGYTIKIQEDKPIDKNKQKLLRRRGIALDSNDNIVAATDLTFSDNLNQIVTEVRYKLSLYLKQGLIGVNTADSSPNQITDDDALGLAEDLGSNPLQVNNIKAQANNPTTNAIQGQPNYSIEGRPIDPKEPIESRIGGGNFVPVDGTGISKPPLTSKPKGNTKNKTINTDALITPLLQEQKEANPQFKAIQDVFNTLNNINPETVGQILNQPGSEQLSDEELLATLKTQVLSSLDPNPDKVKEVQRKTAQWYEGLRNQARIDWEQSTIRNNQAGIPPIPFEDYFLKVEEQELPKWVKLLLRRRYTETEIQFGIDDMDIRDKFQIGFGPNSEVKVKLRPAFKRKS
jgi:hypothetical protein